MTEVVATSPFQPFGEANQGGFDVAKRQAELNAHGAGMVMAVSRGLTQMAEAGIVADQTSSRDRETGHVRFATAPREPGDHVGGWREFTDDKGATKLIHVEITQPANPKDKDGPKDGFALIKIAEPRPKGTTKLVGEERFVRVDMRPGDDGMAAHVSGKSLAHKFSVDYPNERSMNGDLGVADALFREAAVGLAAMAEQAHFSLGLPELPAAQK